MTSAATAIICVLRYFVSLLEVWLILPQACCRHLSLSRWVTNGGRGVKTEINITQQWFMWSPGDCNPDYISLSLFLTETSIGKKQHDNWEILSSHQLRVTGGRRFIRICPGQLNWFLVIIRNALPLHQSWCNRNWYKLKLIKYVLLVKF